MFAQSTAVLFGRPVSLDELSDAVSELHVGQRLEGKGDWMSGKGSLVVRSRSGENGAVAITPFHEPWPDSMGGKEQPDLFGAWAMHFFGWGTFPLCLARAAAFSQSNPERTNAVVDLHATFVRCNLSYVFGAGPDALVFPEDRDVRAELRVLAAIGRRLLKVPGAIAWFHPAGEVLRLRSEVLADLDAQASGDLRPGLWVSTRSHATSRKAVVETVGMGCFGRTPMSRPDHQLVVPRCDVTKEQLEAFLAKVSGIEELGRDEIPDGPVIGPGGLWQAASVESDNPPPRALVRWRLESDAASFVAPAEVSEEEARRWASHLEDHLGASGDVFHELVSDVIHLDVLRYPPAPGRPFHVLVTQGMSALPMTVPEGFEEVRHAELMIALPESWVLEGEESSEDRWFWPVRMLKFIARLPHLYETWIGSAHTIPNGDPAEPYAPNTKLCGAIIGAPESLPDSVIECDTAPGKKVFLYAVYPIHQDEMDFKLANGSDALMQKMADRKVSMVIDPERRSCLKKRFWVV